AQYTTPERYRNNFSNTVVLGDPTDFTRFIRQARTLGEGMFDHGTYVAVRESRHIKAVRMITLQDILSFHRPEDTVATFFSNYDPKGKNSSDIVYAGFLPPPMSVAIPLSALIALTQDNMVLEGLLVVGKAIGATHDAAPGLRMQLDMMHLGYVAGLAASQAIGEHKNFSSLDIRTLQEEIQHQTGDSLQVALHKAPDAETLVASITEEHLKDWTHLPFELEIAGSEPLLLAALAPHNEILEPLERRFVCEDNPRVKLTLAQLVLWHRSDRATPYILDTIVQALHQAGENNLPKRQGSMMCVQLLPDHGVMAETVNLLNLLSWSKNPGIYKPFEQVVDKLANNERDYFDNAKSIFNYMESTPYVAERTCLPEFIPLLRKLLGLPEIQNCMHTDHANPMLRERHALLVLSLYRALARLGDSDGYEGLVALLQFDALTIRRGALLELQALTGKAYPLDQKRWKEEISNTSYAPNPITERVW
ncbi:MAG: FAD-dependent oxidoreductase, partial [Spirochaetia bacterium]|nr:FAD-dependent oxidoreductase [Spirochaetia bacterium]